MDDEMSEEEIAAHQAALAAMAESRQLPPGSVRAGDSAWRGENDNLGAQRAHEENFHSQLPPEEEMVEARAALIQPPNDKLPEDLYDRQAMGQVGERVRVKNGAAHDDMTKDAEGEIAEVSAEPALAVRFDGMDELHRWYVASELDRVSGTAARRGTQGARPARENPRLSNRR
jgi:hypothetical protein